MCVNYLYIILCNLIGQFGEPYSTVGSLRSTTATSTKTSPQNITLHYLKFLAIRPSYLRRTMWVKYPKNRSLRAISEQK